MAKKIQAKFANGALKPLKELDLEEGQDVSITIDAESNLGYEKWIERFGSVDQELKKLEGWEEIKKYLHDYRHPERRVKFGE